MSARPPLSELLADPATMVLRTDLIRAGWPERAVDALFRRRGRHLPGYSRPYVLAGDVNQNGFGFVESQNGLETPMPDTVFVMSSTTPATLPRGMGSAWIAARGEGKQRRFLVRFRAGGRESKELHAGSFKRKSDALLRQQFVSGLLAAGRGADIHSILRSQASDALTVTEAGKRWLGSRIDISPSTKRIHGDSLRRLEETDRRHTAHAVDRRRDRERDREDRREAQAVDRAQSR